MITIVILKNVPNTLLNEFSGHCRVDDNQINNHMEISISFISPGSERRVGLLASYKF